MTDLVPAAGLGHVVSHGTWRFVIHHRWCPDFRRSIYKGRCVSPGMRLVACGHCRPSEAEIATYLPLVGIEVHSHGGLGMMRASRPRALEAGA